jgi:hypothetical protein
MGKSQGLFVSLVPRHVNRGAHLSHLLQPMQRECDLKDFKPINSIISFGPDGLKGQSQAILHLVGADPTAIASR